MANTYSEQGILQQSTYADLYDKQIDDVLAQADSSPLQGKQFFRKVSCNNVTYKESAQPMSLDLPIVNNDTEEIPWAQQAAGYSKEFTLVNFRLGIRVERTMEELDQYSMIANMINALPMAMSRKKEYLFATIFNNGFTTTGADGVALFHDSHPQADAAAGTWDNLETAAALSFGSMDTMRVNMRQRTQEKGFVSPKMLDTLIVPPALQREAEELSQATMNPENALHQPNVNRGFKVIVYDWLTSATAYFGMDTSAGKGNDNGFLYMVRVEPSVAAVTPENPDIIYARRIRGSLATGATHAKLLHGNQGA